ncbi:Lsm12p KNAG_0I02200 [Huiozyma naganishii CBS 8797]|uniref:AD domain-containing protein n=1 Tax=Huiozyma naganishii (strain ATCC MYA-139 / BCRC 22969 / CBS 8797 / KCTC 17520 / NBRC 10181 / NCYC 3082 / Yp74L-3) TaxID=1071383 RepID=J7SAB2_HUIN7|nr:hypothetical protein KNAG_0I02200 [Kazachstania naganishii CBS 8797]CCK72006.1 hypothetical protein KNAG_0I02200 [Kazachstania naganishii CBS 8797]
MSVSLEHIIGFKVRVTNLLDVVTEGKIYSFNSTNNSIVLQTSKKNQAPFDFKVIKCSFIKHLTVVGEKPSANSFKRQFIKPSVVHVDRVEELLRDKIAASDKQNLLRGRGISPEGQLIFDLIYKTIPDTKWVDKDIVILDDIAVVPPYHTENITTRHENQSVSLIERIVERGWAQMRSNSSDNNSRKGG